MKEEDLEEVKRLLDWIYSRELSWLVIILTCFIGLIELLPEIRYYGPSFGDTCLTFLLTFIALTLVCGCVFSIDRFVRLTNVEGVLEQKLPKTMRYRLHSTTGPVHKIVYQLDEDGNLLCLKNWIVPLTSLIFMVIWILIISLKIT